MVALAGDRRCGRARRRSSSPSGAARTRCCRWSIFRSRQFSAANLVTFVVYAALGGFFFLFVAFLQISMGYSPIAAGRGDPAGDRR